MKIFNKILSFCFGLLICLNFMACEDTTPIYNADNTWDDDGVLKILAVGNSFSVDSMQYVCEIAKEMGVEKVELGNLYIGSCTLEMHLDRSQSEFNPYTYYTRNESKAWSKKNYSYKKAVEENNWDFITFQQGSALSGKEDTYSYLIDLIELTKPMCTNQNVKFAWHMTWAYQGNSTHESFPDYSSNQMVMYNAIVNAVQTNIVNNSDIFAIIPNGTAIQNARTSYLGDTLTRDGYHLSHNQGRYIAGVTTLATLIGMDYDRLDFSKVIEDEKFASVVKESVKNAMQKPFEVTNSQITA